MAIVEVAIEVLIVLAAAWVGTNAMTGYAAWWLLKRSKAESVRQKDEVVEHFDQKLEKVKEDLGTADDAGRLEVRIQEVQDGLTARLDELKFEDRISEVRDEVRTFYEDFAGFSEQLGKDLESLPRRLQMGMIGEKGNEVVAMQAYLEKVEGEEIVPAQSMMEAIAAEDPDLIVATAMQKVAGYSPSEKWVSEHPLTAAALEIGKPMIMQKLAEFMGVPGQSRLKKGRGAGGSVYGR